MIHIARSTCSKYTASADISTLNGISLVPILFEKIQAWVWERENLTCFTYKYMYINSLNQEHRPAPVYHAYYRLATKLPHQANIHLNNQCIYQFSNKR